MAKRRGGSSAARSAAAKKGWETRRRGGGAAKSKGKATAPTKAITSSGGKLGKSAKNTAARAKYKEAASKYRSTEKMAAGVRKNMPSHAAFWNRKAGGAKSALTRISNNLSGKSKRSSAGSKPAKAVAAKRRKG